ncbi:MAG TPA: glutathione S-transferase family protein [Planctomycetota bacterium]
MPEKLVLFEIPPSPNSVKARLALNYKGLPFERRPIDFKAESGRAEIIRLSGQPLTPMLLHGERAVWDSAAILRYLDTAFPSSPRLYSEDVETMYAIDGWEKFGRVALMEPLGKVIGQFFSGKVDPALSAEASKEINALTARIEERLADGKFLVGDCLTAADITCAPGVFYAMVPEQFAQEDPAKFLCANFHLGEGRDRTRDWAMRIMQHDGVPEPVG